MNKVFHIFFLTLLALAHEDMYGANLGTPFVQYFSKANYEASAQNWGLFQHLDGRMFFANNEGLLGYDGHNWSLNPLPNKTIVRSICAGPNNRIYTGGQDELGYFAPGANGELVFTSIKPALPAELQQFEDVWDLVYFGKALFVRTLNRLITSMSGQVESLGSEGKFEMLTKSGNEIWAFDTGKGLLRRQNNSWETFATPDQFENGTVNSLIHVRDQVWVSTVKNVLFRLDANS